MVRVFLRCFAWVGVCGLRVCGWWEKFVFCVREVGVKCIVGGVSYVWMSVGASLLDEVLYCE